MADMLKKVPVREQDPKVRATNFDEVCLGYNLEEAMDEATRCLNCKNAKCIQGCPVSIDIPAFIHEVKEGNIEEAYKVIGKSSALPAICGRVCPQESQCEGKCIRGIKGEPVSIGKLERFVADYALENDIKPVGAETKNGHKVAVIGSGPSGLTCAGDLAKMGYDVTVFEALHELGGVLVYGIPEFRLPKQRVVAKEIEKVKELGVKFETNVVIGKSTTIDQLMEDEGFEAVFIGSGAGLPMFMGIPGENANEVFSANEYLTRSNLMKAYDDSYDTPIAAGKKVAVVGGGNVAMDAARTALRLGADVHIVYRRSEAELPARVEEVHHAKEEGVVFNLLTNPKKINVDENGNAFLAAGSATGDYEELPMSAVFSALETKKAPAIAVIDACYSGDMAEEGGRSIWEAFASLFSQLDLHSVKVIAASGSDELSYMVPVFAESGEQESHGALTASILEILGWRHTSLNTRTVSVSGCEKTVYGRAGYSDQTITADGLFEELSSNWRYYEQTPTTNQIPVDIMLLN